jgi:type VI secretion system secreted protein VgrG
MVDRAMSLVAPSGQSATVVELRSQEELGSLFQTDVEIAVSGSQPLALASWVGQRVVVSVSVGGQSRYVSGICSRIAEGAASSPTTYHVTIVPSIWPLTRAQHSRIFQNMSALDILHKLLTGYNVNFQVSAKPAPRAVCVQYRETDFAFVQRLIEEEGFLAFSVHSPTGDSTVITDGLATCPGLGAIAVGTGISGFTRTQELRASKVTLRDHDFETPRTELTGTAGGGGLEIYDYPGGFSTAGDGATRARIRLDQESFSATTGQGTSTVASLAAGATFSLKGSGHGDGTWLVSSVQSDIVQRGDVAPSVATRFSCVPATAPVRPARRTKKPVIGGVQTATVVGPSGQTVYVDRYARIKVQFRWDRDGTSDDHSSGWIRLGALWAGPRHGPMGLPMVGNEVVVAFEEGDPDRPMVVGSVYNASNPTPVPLPDDK